MSEPTDHELLAEYARTGAEAVFGQLVARHINLVHSAARRYAGNEHLAEEITQAVFLILARKAGKLSQATVLSGWLYQTARLTAANALKADLRRQRREQEAYMQSQENETDAAVWREIAPLLDDAMGKLGETDRTVLVLRFFERQTNAQVAAALGLAEGAVQKRVLRALEKLRASFARQGVTHTAQAIAGSVNRYAVLIAPAGLTAAIATNAAKGAVIATSLSALTNGTLKTLAMTTTQKTLITAALVASVGVGIYQAKETAQARAEMQTLQAREAPLAEQIRQLQAERDKATNLIASLQEDLAKNEKNKLELLKLRNQITMLHSQTSNSLDSAIEPEPSYEERTLSEWLADLDVPRNVPNPQAEKAREAIQAMGSATFPFLVKSLSGGGDDTRMRRAVRGFEALGPMASSLIPDFPALFEKSPGYSLHALAAIGKDSTPMLIQALTHENVFVRDNAASALTDNLYKGVITPQEAATALPIALQNLTYANENRDLAENVKWRSAELIGAIGLQSDDAIPALLQTMNNSGDSVTLKCAETLGKLNASKEAVPALTRVANSSTNEIFRAMAQDALKRIQADE